MPEPRRQLRLLHLHHQLLLRKMHKPAFHVEAGFRVPVSAVADGGLLFLFVFHHVVHGEADAHRRTSASRPRRPSKRVDLV